MALHIVKGDTVQIGKDKYDVLGILEEIDKYNTEKNKFIGEHTGIELHKHGSKSLHPTHLLKLYYKNGNEAILLEIVQEKPSKEIEKPKQRGNIFNYINKRVIPRDKIKVIP